jgi:hypothetical protein
MLNKKNCCSCIHSNPRNVEEEAARDSFEQALRDVLEDNRIFLIGKNKEYGDSALNPLRIFSRADAKEQLLVRIDDKLSRIKRGDATKEDTHKDLRGYLNLLEILKRREKAKGEKQ